MSAVLSAPAASPVASAADQPLLRLQNVESAYGPIKAIRGVSLQVRRGEIAAVLGSNGAGKTTILKTISGIIDPRKGSIEFQGADITANDPAAIVRRGLMHVPEGREVFPLLSVRDNLLMGAYTRADKDAVARDIETVFGYFPILKERAAQDAGLLSGGQRQLVALARCLITRPQILLMDEPTSSMDAQSETMFLKQLKAAVGNRTVVLITHRPAALELVDRIVVIDNGKVLIDGPKPQVLAALSGAPVPPTGAQP
eukprot:gene10610-biopygen8882